MGVSGGTPIAGRLDTLMQWSRYCGFGRSTFENGNRWPGKATASTSSSSMSGITETQTLISSRGFARPMSESGQKRKSSRH